MVIRKAVSLVLSASLAFGQLVKPGSPPSTGGGAGSGTITISGAVSGSGPNDGVVNVVSTLNLENLANVNIPSPTNGHILSYDSATSRYVLVAPPSGGGGGFSPTITSPASGQALRYNGSTWVNAALGTADITGLSAALAAKQDTLGASGVTAGTYGSGSAVPVVTVDNRGIVTGLSTVAVSGGGGGGTSYCNVTQTSSVVTVNAPCIVRFGEQATFTLSSNVTFTRSAGSGNGLARIYIASTGQVFFEHASGAGLSITASSGGTALSAATPGWSENAIPLAEVPIVSGNFGTPVDQRPAYVRDAVTAGTGMTVVESAGLKTVGIDTAVVPRLGQPNAWTGNNDFGASSKFVGRKGATDPATCETGEQFYNTTSNTQKFCTSANTWTAPSGGGGGITALTGDVTASGTGSVAATLANSGVTAGSYGGASSVPVITIDAKGRITSASTAAISGGGGGGGGSTGGDSYFSVPNATVNASATWWANAYRTGFGTTYSIDRGIIATVPMRLRNMYVTTSGAQTGTGTMVCTARVNGGAATALAVVIPAGATAGTFSDLVDTVDVAQGDILAVACQNNGSATSASVATMSFFMEPLISTVPLPIPMTPGALTSGLTAQMREIGGGTGFLTIQFEEADTAGYYFSYPKRNNTVTVDMVWTTEGGDSGNYRAGIQAWCWPNNTRLGLATLADTKEFTLTGSANFYQQMQTQQNLNVTSCGAADTISYKVYRLPADAADTATAGLGFTGGSFRP